MDKIVAMFGIVGLTIVLMLIITFPFMWVWNAIMPDIFGLPTIGFWQSLGLMFIANVLRSYSPSSKSN